MRSPLPAFLLAASVACAAPTVKDLALAEARKHDANSNGKVDGNEMGAVRDAWRTNPKSYLYLFDDNSNRYLEDSELSKLRFEPAPKKKSTGASKGGFWKTPPAGSQMKKPKKK